MKIPMEIPMIFKALVSLNKVKGRGTSPERRAVLYKAADEALVGR